MIQGSVRRSCRDHRKAENHKHNVRRNDNAQSGHNPSEGAFIAQKSANQF
jgi:hypothetical protein